MWFVFVDINSEFIILLKKNKEYPWQILEAKISNNLMIDRNLSLYYNLKLTLDRASSL